MFGGKKEKALQDELYTIKKQIAEYSDELKEDSVQMTAQPQWRNQRIGE